MVGTLRAAGAVGCLESGARGLGPGVSPRVSRTAPCQPVSSVRGRGGGAAAILVPGEAGADRGGGPRSCACSAPAPPPPILLAGVTSRLGSYPHKGPALGCSPPRSTALALVAACPPPPWGSGGGGRSGGSAPKQVLPVRACRCLPTLGCVGW